MLVEPLVLGGDERRLHVGRHLAERHDRPALEPEVGDEPAVGGVDLGRLVGIVAAQLGDGGAAVPGARAGPGRRQDGQPEGDDREKRDQNDATGAGREPNALQQTGLPAGHAPKLAGCGARFQRVRLAPMSDLLDLLDGPRLRAGRHPRSGRAAARRARSRPTWASIRRRTRSTSATWCRSWAWRGCSGWGTRPIALVGGGTGMVGDPSGKRAERPVLTLEQIDRNAQAILRQLRAVPRLRGRQRRPAPQQRGLARDGST